MPLYPYLDSFPQIHEEAYISEGVYLTGDVRVGRKSSVWYGTVARGDINTIQIGDESNIQDGSILHVDDDYACLVGDRVVVGHQAVLHGTTIEDDCLVGIGAKLLNGSVIRKGAMVAAGSVVSEGMEIPEGMLAMGVPAKVKRPLRDEETNMIHHLSQKYIKVFQNYQKSCEKQEKAQ